VTFVRDKPGVRFSRASELLKRYADDTYTRTFSRAEVLELARATAGEIAFRRVGNTSLSGADAFSLLTSAALAIAEKRGIPDRLKAARLYGPAHAFARSAGPQPPSSVPWAAFEAAVGDTADYCVKHGRIPDEVWIGSRAISPQDYLATCAAVVEQSGSAAVPPGVDLRSGRLSAEKYVAKDSPSLWDWPIFPDGFHAPDLMELARLQAWTLKPAILH
jgi:hypothetical protein